MAATLLNDQADLRREVLLWQRWVRYLALSTLVLLWLMFGSTVQDSLVPVAVLAMLYVGCVMLSTWALQRRRATIVIGLMPELMLAADIVTIAGFCYLTGSAQQLHRVLLLGLLSVQLAVFYFGRRQGVLAAALTVAAYLVVSLLLPPSGEAPTALVIAFNTTLFAIVSTVLVHTFGSFRERMDQLRTYCKIVERGEGASVPRLGEERWPDELTLLGRTFDAMRVRLAEQIGTDPLTACLNRRALENRLAIDLRRARRHGNTVAVAAVDLDRFKEINDTYGHPVGDVVLQQIAGIMRQSARDTDAVARVGGDEFLIVLPDTGWEGASAFAERLRRAVDEGLFGPPANPIPITVSVGIALGRGTDALSSQLLIEQADRALYQAKTGGRNRVFA